MLIDTPPSVIYSNVSIGGQLGIPGHLSPAVVAVLVLPPAFGAFHGMHLPGGRVGILLMDALSLTRTGVSP